MLTAAGISGARLASAFYVWSVSSCHHDAGPLLLAIISEFGLYLLNHFRIWFVFTD